MAPRTVARRLSRSRRTRGEALMEPSYGQPGLGQTYDCLTHEFRLLPTETEV